MVQVRVKAPEKLLFVYKPTSYNEINERRAAHVTIPTLHSLQLPLFGMIHIGTSSIVASFEQPDRLHKGNKNVRLYTKAQ